jgi:hypothetical protein
VSQESALTICAQACVLIGAAPLTSFSQQGAEAIVANQIYETTVRAKLLSSRYRFTLIQAPLGNPLASVPLSDWDYGYAYPQTPECLAVDGLFVGDQPVAFDRFDNILFTNAAAADMPVLYYAYRAAEKDWPPAFVASMVLELASLFALPVTQDVGIASFWAAEAKGAWPVTRRLLAQEQTARRIRAPSRLVGIRRG